MASGRTYISDENEVHFRNVTPATAGVQGTLRNEMETSGFRPAPERQDSRMTSYCRSEVGVLDQFSLCCSRTNQSEGDYLTHSNPCRVWTIAEAKARLSEVLRLAEEEGPQRIGVRKTFVVVPEKLWQSQAPKRKPLGQWLVENALRGIEHELPDRNDKERDSRSYKAVGTLA